MGNCAGPMVKRFQKSVGPRFLSQLSKAVVRFMPKMMMFKLQTKGSVDRVSANKPGFTASKIDHVFKSPPFLNKACRQATVRRVA